MSEVPQLEHFNKKIRSPEMTNFFLYCIKKMSFSAHDWCRRTMKKKLFCNENPMEFGGDPQKNDSYVHWGPIFYVCSSARNWVSSMYKGIYHIRNSLWQVAPLDV